MSLDTLKPEQVLASHAAPDKVAESLADSAISGEPRADSLADGVALLLLLSATQPLVGLLRGVLFCRWLSPAELGQWDLALGFLTVVSPLVDLGIPGALGRFVEHFRQRRALRAFLAWAMAVCAVLTAAAAVLIHWQAPRVASWLFEGAAHAALVEHLAVCLVACVLFGFLVELLVALRQSRVVTVLQFLRSGLFLLAGAALFGWRRGTALDVVSAYGLGSLLPAILAMAWLRRAWPRLPGETHEPLGGLSRRVVPVALAFSLTHALANVFDVIDRYLLMYFIDRPAAETLELVANYHSSRVLPSMFVTLAIMLGGLLLPHLAHAWESGDRRRAELRLNLALKLFSGLLGCGALGVLVVGPWLFDLAWKEKFAAGAALLPGALAYSSLFGLANVAVAALFCNERARASSLAFAAGLVVNVGLAYWLLPRYGLGGAVVASIVAKAVLLALLLVASTSGRLAIRRSTWIVVFALPLSATLGAAGTALALAVSAGLAVRGSWVLADDERTLLRDVAVRYRQKLLGRLRMSAAG